MRVLISQIIIIMTILTVEARAETDAMAVCFAMVSNAVNNVGLDIHSKAVIDVVFDDTCESDGTSKNVEKSAAASAFINNLPIGLKGKSSDLETSTKNFCRNYSSKRSVDDSSLQATRVVVEGALGSVDDCVRIAANSQNPIIYKILTPSRLAIHVNIRAGSKVTIRGIHLDPPVKCIGNNPNKPGYIINYDTATGQELDANVGTYAITCERKPVVGHGDEAVYSPAAIVVDTNAGALNIIWPPEKLLPVKSATQIGAFVTRLETQVADLKTRLEFNLLPIGTLMPWFDKAKQPPKGWAKCDGSDATNCPDLTNIFLLGGPQTKIGEKGGSETITISTPGNENGAHPAGEGWSLNGNHYVASYSANLPKPPYMTVLYIKKIGFE